MPKKDDEKYNFIPAAKVCAEWRKDPEYMRKYEKQKLAFDRECDTFVARRERRKAVLAWMRGVGMRVRGVWAYLTGEIDERVL